MPMTLKLMDEKGNEIFYWAPDEDNWWITGFDPSEQGFLANELVAVYTLDFSENEKMRGMFGALYDAWYGVDDRWTFDAENHIATFEFKK